MGVMQSCRSSMTLMQRVLLIGDSIRLHYEPVVRQKLADEAEVFGPDENCETSRNVRARLSSWLKCYRPDVIHLNCGLHDVRVDPGSASVQVPPTEYAENVTAIVQSAQRGGRVVIWATTTPVDEALHCANKMSRRRKTDVSAYNASAVAAALKAGAKINDLHQVVETHGAQSLWQADGVHFNERGYRLLGGAVAREIRRYLPRSVS